MDNANSGLTAADVLALGNKNDMAGAGYFWWVIIFFIIAGMFSGNGFFGGNNNAATSEFIANQFSDQNNKFMAMQNTSGINQNGRDILETNFGTTKEVLENRYNNALQTNQLQADMNNNALRTQMQISNNALQSEMQSSNNALNSQMQMAQYCCQLREEGTANTQKILDAMCQNQIEDLRQRLADRDRELQTARFQISQIDQTANITNTLRPYPTPSYIVSSPYTSIFNPYYGYYGYGVASAV